MRRSNDGAQVAQRRRAEADDLINTGYVLLECFFIQMVQSLRCFSSLGIIV